MNEWLPSQALTRMARPVPLVNTSVSRKEILRFGYRIGALNFLVPEGVLSELLRAPAIYPIPNVSNALRGYVNRQGALIPVWDVTRIIDCEIIDDHSDASAVSEIRGRSDGESVLVLGTGDARVGMVIDALPRAIRNIDKASRLPLLPALLVNHVRAAVFADSELWLEFNHETFFGALALDSAA